MVADIVVTGCCIIMGICLFLLGWIAILASKDGKREEEDKDE